MDACVSSINLLTSLHGEDVVLFPFEKREGGAAATC